jgi:hypothetical protein
MIDTDKYDGHTTTHWSTRNQGTACDDNPDYFDPYLETDGGNIAIGYFDAGSELHSLEEKRANMRLMADAHLLLAEVKRLYEMMDILASFHVVKNVEQGFTQREWVELVELAKRGEEE